MVLAHHSAVLQEQWSRELLAAATAAATATGINNTQQLFPIAPRETPPAHAGEASQLPFKSQLGRPQLASGLHLTAASFSLPDFSQSSLLQLRNAAATSRGEKPRSYVEEGEGTAQQPQPQHRKRQRENEHEQENSHEQGTPTLRGADAHHELEVEVRSQDSFGEVELIAPSGNQTVRSKEEKGPVKATDFRLEDALDRAEREQARAMVLAPIPAAAPRLDPTTLRPSGALLPNSTAHGLADSAPKLYGSINNLPHDSNKDRFPTLGGMGYGMGPKKSSNPGNNSTAPNATHPAGAGAAAKPLLHQSFALESQVVSYNNDY
jgi:hypothetical protein